MEFFEKAHVSKRTSQKRGRNSEENVKKQLKQMLQGYKQNDNELIKNSGNQCSVIDDTHKALDDSSSVSGFSDLDLTISEGDEEINLAVSSEAYEDNLSSTSDVNLCSLDSVENSDDTTNDNTDKIVQELDENKAYKYLEPILEDDEDAAVSLSEDTDVDFNSFSQMSLGSSSQSLTNDTVSEEFDADGLLASRIMENLEKNRCNTKIKNNKIIANNKKNKKKKTDSNIVNKDSNSANDKIDKLKTNDNDITIGKCSDMDTLSINHSSPFISITVTDMTDKSLSEILGDYKYPTIRNILYEKQNISFTNNSGIFTVDDDMQVEETNSLIPEIGDDPIIEDLEMDLSEVSDNESIVEDTGVSSLLPHSKVDDEVSIRSSNPVKVYYADNSCIFVLKNPSELYINGKVKIKPLNGTVEVFGYIIKQEVDLYSSNNNFAQRLKTVPIDNECFGLFSKLTASGLSVSDAEDIVTSLGEYDCVIKMSPLINPKVDFVDNYSSTSLFSKLKTENNAHRLSEVSQLLSCNIYLSRPLRSFQEHPDWEEVINCGLKDRSRGIVCGGKGVGKSTFVRYYINRILNNGPVLVVDLDPGQAEFTVAGCISATIVDEPLLGPNYTHLKTPEISYNIGMINTMDNIYRYTSTVAKLIEYCRNKYHYMPWIVNTMGMTNNIGLKFILLTIIHIQPTFLIQIDSKIAKKRFECYLEPDIIRTLYESYSSDRLFKSIVLPNLDYNFILTRHIEDSYKQDTSLSPKEERYLNFLAYLGEMMNTHSRNFLEIVPYRVSLSDLNIVTNVRVEKDAILKVINGKIVALCQLDTTDKGKVFILGDNSPVCHGHGLIRGVEFETNEVYLMTSEAPEQLRFVNALVYSDWTPELQGTERHLPPGTPVPYRGVSQHNLHMRAPRRRFNPLQLLKTKRST